MKNTEAKEILSSLSPDLLKKQWIIQYPQNLSIVKQKYTGSTLEGSRSTCQVASVINAARMVGYNVSDFQDQIITDRRVPWDRATGGIPSTETPLMTGIYRDYMEGVPLSDFSIFRSIDEVFEALIVGKGLAVSTGSIHSVAVAGFYRVADREFPVSLIANPLFGSIKAFDWLEILTKNILQVDTYPDIVAVHTTFVIG